MMNRGEKRETVPVLRYVNGKRGRERNQKRRERSLEKGTG